jgi:DnaJ-domain-containing protein 1
MSRKATGKKHNVWTDPSPYGTYEGEKGSPNSWKTAFEYATYSREKALGILINCNETPREILGVGLTATAEEIKKMYRKLALINHPDKGGNRDDFEKIHAAYSILIA